MMNKKSCYASLPIVVFALLTFIFLRALFLHPQRIPSVMLNQPIPKFEVIDLIKGESINQSVLKGKWTILNIWASWCEACAIEHPYLLNLSSQGINLVGLNYKDEAEIAKTWLDNYGNPYQLILFDKLGNVAIDFGVYGSPETFLIDKQGIIRYRHVGILTQKTWQTHFLPLMKGEIT